MTKEIIGNCLIMVCNSCGAQIFETMTPELKKSIRRKKILCPVCQKEIL